MIQGNSRWHALHEGPQCKSPVSLAPSCFLLLLQHLVLGNRFSFNGTTAERERERARAAAAAPRSGVDQSPFCAISHSLLPFKTTRTVGSQSVNYEVMHCKKISESGMHQHMESPAWEKDWINMDKHGINRKRVKLNPRPSNPLHPSQLVKGRTNSCRTSLPSTEAPKS